MAPQEKSAGHARRGHRNRNKLELTPIFPIGVGMIWIFYDSIFLVMVGWVVTGLGGGTVYMIKGLMKGSKSIHTSSSKAVESYGHVMGLLVSLFAVTSHNFGVMYISSIFFATATVLISLFAIQKEGRIYVRD